MTSADVPFTEDELLLRFRRTDPRRLPGLVLFALRLVRRSAPRDLHVVCLLQLLGALGLAGQLLLTREILGVLLAPGEVAVRRALLLVLALSGLTLVVTLTGVLRAERQQVLALLVEREAVDLVIGIAADVDLVAFDDPTFHNRLQRAQANAALRPVDMVLALLGLLNAAVTLAGIVVVLATISPIFVPVLAVGWIPVWLASRYASRVTYAFTAKQTERDRRRAYLYHLLTGREFAAELRACGLSSTFRATHSGLFDARLTDLREAGRRRIRAGAFSGGLNAVVSGAALALLVGLLAGGRLTVAEAGTTAGALVLIRGRLQGLVGSAGALYDNALYLEDLTSFVEDGSLRREALRAAPAPGGFSLLSAQGVGFRYPAAARPALEDVTVSVGRGEIIALVGENGSGKTTLAKILAGLYQPTSGQVLWDGVDTAGYDAAALRSEVAVAFQDYAKYFLTARDNIGAGRPDRPADDEAVRLAARRAGAEDILAQLPAGYDTLLGPEYFGGTDLSIGQWQRIALARAFFRDAPLVILDEPSASLDPRAEYELFENVRSLLAGRSVVLISHRFSSVRSADRIYVLREGRVVEHGSHDELMAAAGLYRELFLLQADAYLIDRSAPGGA
jgi:ATP-binding cassette subfamily B protein